MRSIEGRKRYGREKIGECGRTWRLRSPKWSGGCCMKMNHDMKYTAGDAYCLQGGHSNGIYSYHFELGVLSKRHVWPRHCGVLIRLAPTSLEWCINSKCNKEYNKEY